MAKGKIFSRLEERYRLAVEASNGTDIINNPNIDDELKNYARWRQLKQGRQFDGEIAGTPNAQSLRDKGEKRSRGIKSFGVDLPAAIFLHATITDRTEDWLAEAGQSSLRTSIGYELAISDAEYVIPMAGFKPATVTIRIAATTRQDRTSRITRQNYKSKFDRSSQGYVIPFGKTGSMTYMQKVGALKEEVADITRAYATYKNEVFPTLGILTNVTLEANAE